MVIVIGAKGFKSILKEKLKNGPDQSRGSLNAQGALHLWFVEALQLPIDNNTTCSTVQALKKKKRSKG